MKIVYVSDCLYIPMCGAKQSSLAHLKTLKELVGSENITVIALTGKNKVYDNDVITINSYHSKIALFVNSIFGYTTYTNKKIEELIADKLITDEYDVVFIDNSFYGKLVRKIKEKHDKIWIISYYHDVKQELCKQWIENSSIFKVPLFRTMMKNERLNQSLCDVNLTLNKRETELFIKHYKKCPTDELGVYLNIPYVKKVDEKNKLNYNLNLLFVGNYYYPNVKGILWFVKYVWPYLKDKVQLTIVGNGMERLKNKLPGEINLYGFVESLATFYIDADVVISPIFEGGGMKVKTAEALGYGKCIVGTSESFEGYVEKMNKKDINRLFYISNTPEEFIEAISDLQYKGVRKFNDESRRLYELYYSEKSAINIFKRSLKIESEGDLCR